MKLIGESSTRLKWAALPIGDNFTMGVDDAIPRGGFYPVRTGFWASITTRFRRSSSDHEDARRKFMAAEKDLVLMGIGETLDL